MLQRAVDHLQEEVGQKKLTPEKAVDELSKKMGREFLISEKMSLAAALAAGEKEKIVSRLRHEAPIERDKTVSISR